MKMCRNERDKDGNGCYCRLSEGHYGEHKCCGKGWPNSSAPQPTSIGKIVGWLTCCSGPITEGNIKLHFESCPRYSKLEAVVKAARPFAQMTADYKEKGLDDSDILEIHLFNTTRWNDVVFRRTQEEGYDFWRREEPGAVRFRTITVGDLKRLREAITRLEDV